MAVIVYRKYTFNEPPPLTTDQFTYLKRQITASGDFEPNTEFKTTFTSKYKKNIRWFGIGALVFIGSLISFKALFGFGGPFGTPQGLMLIPIILGGGTMVFTLMQTFLEGPSMATYLTKRKLYFGRMKHAIRYHSDYSTFYVTFYGDGKKNSSGRNAPFLEEALQEQKKAPKTMDHFLTRTFYWIDQHFYKIILAVIAIVLIKKYLIK